MTTTSELEITVVRAENEEKQKAIDFQIEWFSKLHLGLPPKEGAKIIGANPFQEAAEIFIAKEGEQIIGTTTIFRRNPDLAERFGTIFGLPIENFYDLSSIKDLDLNIVQPSNTVVKPEYHKKGVVVKLWRMTYRGSVFHDPASTHVITLDASEIRDEAEVINLFQRIRKSKYYDENHEIKLKDDERNRFFAALPIIENDVNRLVLPRQIRMYNQMNFKVNGPPVYHDNFRMYDFPMLLKLDELISRLKDSYSQKNELRSDLK